MRDRDYGSSPTRSTTSSHAEQGPALRLAQLSAAPGLRHCAARRRSKASPGGYHLVYTAEPPSGPRAPRTAQERDLTYSGGRDRQRWQDRVRAVGSAAFNAGVTVGAQIVAVNGRKYDDDAVQGRRSGAREHRGPMPSCWSSDGDVYRTVTLDWHGGLRYPRLEKAGKGRERSTPCWRRADAERGAMMRMDYWSASLAVARRLQRQPPLGSPAPAERKPHRRARPHRAHRTRG